MLGRCSFQQSFTSAARTFAANSSCKAKSRPFCSTSHSRQWVANNSYNPCRRGESSTSRQSLHTKRRVSYSIPQKVDRTPKSDSIFSSEKSAWDNVLADIQDMPPLVPSARNPSRTPNPPNTGPRPRQSMTAREIRAFDEMFNMIFDVATENQSPKADSNIGVGRGNINDLFGKLRKHSRKMKWERESDEVLDGKKEEIDMCDTDYELLGWAMTHVFEESEKYEAAALKAISEASESGKTQDLPRLQPPEYPHLLALLMRTFRDKYHDPHLALAMFDHARHLSIASYVFGCSTQAYNELIETRWSCFQDIQGVHDALEEMAINGVQVDSLTRKLVEKVRRDVGRRNLWDEPEAQSGETWTVLRRIEELVSKPKSRSLNREDLPSPSATPIWDAWKASPLDDKPNDEWGFDNWGPQEPDRRGPREQRTFSKDRRRNTPFGLKN